MGFLQHIVRAQIGCHGRAAMAAAATGRRWLIQQQRLLATGAHDDLIPQQRWTTTSSSRSCGTTTTTKRPLIESVVFDFDGVIIDSETIFYRINSETLAHFGVQYTMELKQGQMGRKLTEGVDYVLKRTGLAERGVSQQQYLTIYGKLVDQLLPNCQLMPGARRLVEHLHKSSAQMAICTGSASDEFAKKVDNCQDLVTTMNTVVLAGDDPEVRLGKPAPDAYLVTMRRMRPQPRDPSRVLVFEDSVHGVDSALSAGCQVIWVPQKQFLLDDLDTMVRHFRRHPSFAEALESLEQFRPEKYGLPAFSS